VFRFRGSRSATIWVSRRSASGARARDDPAELLFECGAGHARCAAPAADAAALRHAQLRQARVSALGAQPLLREGRPSVAAARARSLAARFAGDSVGFPPRPVRPPGVQQLRLGAADLLAQPAIALRLADLFLQGLDLRPRGFRITSSSRPRLSSAAFSFQLGFVAPRVQPGGGRPGLVEQQPAARSALPRSARPIRP